MTRIKLYKGDDSAFADRTIHVTLDTALELAGYSAKFSLQGIVQSIDDVSAGEFDLTFPASMTKRFSPCECWGRLILFDSEGLQKTVSDRFPFVVEHQRDISPEQDTTEMTVQAVIDAAPVTIHVGVAGIPTGADFVRANPEDANFRVENGCVLKIYDVYTRTFEAVWFDSSSGKRKLKWEGI